LDRAAVHVECRRSRACGQSGKNEQAAIEVIRSAAAGVPAQEEEIATVRPARLREDSWANELEGCRHAAAPAQVVRSCRIIADKDVRIVHAPGLGKATRAILAHG